MKRLYILLFLVLISAALQAQLFEVDTLFKSGPLQNRINLVFLGDGYTAGEQIKYITDVTEVIDEIFSQEPFEYYKNYFNIFAVKVISVESGAHHPKTSSDSDCNGVPQAFVSNYFGSTFDYGGIHRLLYPTNLSRVSNVLSTHLPNYSQAIIVVNSPYYGGAGGQFATCSDHPNGRDVAIHEIGHSFALLADEYWAGLSYAAEKANMTKETNPELIKWKNWLGVKEIGIYSYNSGGSQWKKPHLNCKMGVLNTPLCAVCSEAFIERFHMYVKPLDKFSPQQTTFELPVSEQTIDFSVELVKPDPNSLKITWEKNDVIFASNQETTSVTISPLSEPMIIRASVLDTISLTKSDAHTTIHLSVVEWKIGQTGTVTHIEPLEKQYKISAFPNPVGEQLTVSFSLTRNEHVNVELMDVAGKRVRTFINAQHLAGEHHYIFNRNEWTTAGQYLLKMSFDKTVLTQNLIAR